PPVRGSLFNDRELVERYPWLPDVQVALGNSFPRPRVPAWDVVEGIIGCAVDQGLQRAAAVPPHAEDAPTQLLDISSDVLRDAADNIEGVMEEWGYYRSDSEWDANPRTRITGDPRDEWTCGGGG